MENIIEFIKKHKTKLLIGLVVLLFFKSCGKSRDVKDLEKKHEIELENITKKNEVDKSTSYNQGQIDALNTVIDDVSKINRPPVLMDLHNKWINDRDKISKGLK